MQNEKFKENKIILLKDIPFLGAQCILNYMTDTDNDQYSS